MSDIDVGRSFASALDPAVVASAIRSRSTSRDEWRRVRVARREAYQILWDREDEAARLFVNTAFEVMARDPKERMRNTRLRFLRKAIQAGRGATRLMEMAIYTNIRQMAVRS